MIFKLNKKEIKKEKGIAALFAVLVAVILISIGATIISIALRQTILSNTGRESQVAFYAANTALECARYWDSKVPVGASSTEAVFPYGTQDELDDTSGVTCSGFNFMEDSSWDDTTPDRYEFEIEISNGLTSETNCASVVVTKEQDGLNIVTTIESRGYNVDTCDSTSPRVVERGLELSYEYVE